MYKTYFFLDLIFIIHTEGEEKRKSLIAEMLDTYQNSSFNVMNAISKLIFEK